MKQLIRYLSRSWTRAGIAGSSRDDCTQSVFAELLEELGRQRFDIFLQVIARSNIPTAMEMMPPEGRAFLRVIDRIKKRARRCRRGSSLVEGADPATLSRSKIEETRQMDDLREAIDVYLTPREVDLIEASLRGEKPSEVASRWGLDAKTVSNEKSRVIRKLRDAVGLVG
jgi:RNA polymerase sigma factor (sigma-70 family)